MLCARCWQERGIKEFEDELLCYHCFDIRIKSHTILELVCNGYFSYREVDAYFYHIEEYLDNGGRL